MQSKSVTYTVEELEELQSMIGRAIQESRNRAGWDSNPDTTVRLELWDDEVMFYIGDNDRIFESWCW